MPEKQPILHPENYFTSHPYQDINRFNNLSDEEKRTLYANTFNAITELTREESDPDDRSYRSFHIETNKYFKIEIDLIADEDGNLPNVEEYELNPSLWKALHAWRLVSSRKKPLYTKSSVDILKLQ